MIDRNPMLDSLRAAVPEAADAVSGLIRSSIHITAKPADDSSLAVGSSKFGGQPDLPPGTDWPSYAQKPLAFVLQVRLSDLAPMSAASVFPKTGLLSFFYEGGATIYGDKPMDRGAWRVLYADGSKAVQRVPTPTTVSARYNACAVIFTEAPSLPQQPAFYMPALHLADTVKDKYENWWIDRQRKAGTADHHLLGYAADIQDDMHAQVHALAHGSKPTASSDAAPSAEALEWVLLLQLDSDESAGMKWGSDGMIYWWIEKAKLQAHDFSNVWLILQSE